MPFNSYPFLVVFLPSSLVFYYLVAFSRFGAFRLPAIIFVTLVFYAIGAARSLPILLGSVAANYLLAQVIERGAGSGRRIALVTGVALNVAALVYFKYADFLLTNVNLAFGRPNETAGILLPLGMSFFTFQQIAFLVDVSRGLANRVRPTTYAASILFFPFIISGPITLWREVGPQLEERPTANKLPGDLLVGLTIFALGLFKKTVIADSLGPWVDPLFDTAAHGQSVGLAGGWGAAIGYLLQMYYDFSGYSDMAIGCARMFGITLPLNFFSPLRCTSIIDWWRRWHMTLGRWVNAYIFQPIAIPLSRWAAMRGLGRRATFAVGTLAPTFVAMMIIGAWHGGNWTFFLFGALHGSYMVIAEIWREATRKRRKRKPPTRLGKVLGNVLTIGAVLVAVVPFRADDLATTFRLWRSMLGLDGIDGGAAIWPAYSGMAGAPFLFIILGGLALAYLAPNTEQFMARVSPALEWPKWRAVSPPAASIEWRPTMGWATSMGALSLLACAFVARGGAGFVYFKF